MNEYDDIDFNDYVAPEEIVIQKPAPKSESKKTVKSNLPSDDIDFADYGASEPIEKPGKYFGQYAPYSPEQYEALSPEKKQELQEYSPLQGVAKGVLSGATKSFSETYPAVFGLAGMALGKTFPIEEHETGAGFGEFLGEAAPIGLGLKVALAPLKFIPTAYKWGTRAYKTGAATLVGSGLEAAKELAKGQDFDPFEIAKQGVTFGAGDVLIRSAMKYVPAVYNWVKGLKPSQRAELLVEGAIPSDMSPTQYKLYQDKVVPTLQDIAQEEFVAASEKATQEANALFEKEMAQVRTKHEEELYNLAQQKKLSDQTLKEAETKFNQEKSTFVAKHEAEMEAIEAANQEAKTAFEEQNSEWQKTVRRQEIVDNAIKNVQNEAAQSLEGRVASEAQDIGVRPAPAPSPAQELEDKVGSIISPKKAPNATQAGEESFAAVRATADADYRVVKDLYKESDKLNKSITSEHPELANELKGIIEFFDSIPEPSGPQKQARQVAEKVLNAIMEFSEEGIATGFKEISNEVLLEQSKVLKHFKDYDFAIGDPGAIFDPLIGVLENSAERAAIQSGNEAAVVSLQKARGKYREWTQLYNNKYIRNYRNTSNHRPKKTFENSLNIDDYRKLDQVLSRTNAGQQISAQTRRELVEKELGSFFENPRSVNKKKFNKALSEMEPILKPGEEQAIRGAFNEARKTPVLQGKKLSHAQKPKEPKLKSIDRVDNIPIFKKPKSNIQEITEVKLPVRQEVKPTPAMKAASKKMKVTPEDVMKKADTPTGLKELKTDLMKREHGKELFEEIGQHKIKEILYGGNVKQKFTGAELYKRINNGKNFDLISEILGEEAALDLLESAAAIGEARMTVNALKKYAKKVGTVKAAMLFGIL
jgi:hypothetical protein